MEPFSIYAHIPFCRLKCPYCDFNVVAAARWPEREYTAALIAELDHAATTATWAGRDVRSVYFGGGTPSLFAPESIDAVIGAVKRLWTVAAPDGDPVEIGLEANPGTLTPESLRGYRDAGVNRLSLGVQSFQPEHLDRLGRDHTPEEAVDAVAMAHAAGLDNVSLDLIFGVPGQSVEQWEDDLRTAVGLGPVHISAYGLTYEPGTAFHVLRSRGYLDPVPEDAEAEMFVRTGAVLAAGGYRHYEVSNYARPGYESRHNLNYWRGGEYLGIGAGAHSFAREPAPGSRWSNEKHPARYIERARREGHARAFEERLTERQARGEFVFLGLRRRDGFSEGEFRGRFGTGFLASFPHAAGLCDQGLLVGDEGRWCLSARGLLVADSVFATFL